jgi:RNA polymerase sigma factor (sigma-70 family)
MAPLSKRKNWDSCHQGIFVAISSIFVWVQLSRRQTGVCMDKQLNTLYLSIRGRLAGAVTNIVPPDEVEDIVQETYVRACKASLVSELRSPRSYMLKTARNLALDHVKRAEYRLSDSLQDDDEGGHEAILATARDTFEQVCSDEDFVTFCSAVRSLPVQCRRAFVLKKVYGYTQREIAAEMKISEKTVEGHIAIGITRCKRIVQSHRSDRGGFDLSSADSISEKPGQ